MPPYSDADDTMWSPDPARFKSAIVSAAWPDATASVPGKPIAVVTPPSSALSRPSNAPCVGFMIRV